MRIIVSFILALLTLQGSLRAQVNQIVTNPLRVDGFGSQFQTIIYSAIYAEMNFMEFRYTPFTAMEHNYDNDNDFLAKKEELINFIGNFDLNSDPIIQSQISPSEYIAFFEKNLPFCVKSNALDKIKHLFKSNKMRETYFSPQYLHIAIHVRRPNPHDSRVGGTNTPHTLYIQTIQTLRERYLNSNPLFHIYSQGDIEDFKTIYNAPDTVLHINGTLEEIFTSLVLADVLVTGSSSMSYTAGILCDGVVYYTPFWHPPLPHWMPLALLEDVEQKYLP